MPMGDLSLLTGAYKSRMFQFLGPSNRELYIHDMKQVEQLDLYLRTVLRQLRDPDILAAVRELVLGETVPFSRLDGPPDPYGAPAPEFQ